MAVATIGLDIAKNVFQVYGADEAGEQLFNRKIARTAILDYFRKLPPCVPATDS